MAILGTTPWVADDHNHDADVAAGNDDQDTAGNLFALGTTQSASDEQRRACEQNVRDMEASMDKLRQATKAEQVITAQVLQDRTHCHKELSLQLVRGSKETLNALELNEQVRLGLADTLRSQLLQDTVDVNKENVHPADKSNENTGGGHSAAGNKSKTANGDKENAGTNNDKKKANNSFEIRNHQHKAKVRELNASIKDVLQWLHQLQDKQQVIRHEAALLRPANGQEEDPDVCRLRKEESTTEQGRASLATAQNGRKSEQASIESVEQRKQDLAQQKQQQLRALATKKKVHATQLTEKKKQIQATQNETARKKKFLAELTDQQMHLAKKTKTIQDELVQIDSLSEVRVAHQAELASAREQRKVLYARNAEVGNLLTEKGRKCDDFARVLVEEEEQSTAIEKEKTANDKVAFEDLEPAKAELADLQDQKTKLSTIVKDMMQELNRESKQLDSDLETGKSQLDTVQEKSKVAAQDRDERLARLKEQERALRDREDETKKELQAIEEDTEHFVENETAQQAHLQEIKLQAAKETSESLTRKCDILELGVSLLERSREKEEKYRPATDL